MRNTIDYCGRLTGFRNVIDAPSDSTSTEAAGTCILLSDETAAVNNNVLSDVASKSVRRIFPLDLTARVVKQIYRWVDRDQPSRPSPSGRGNSIG